MRQKLITGLMLLVTVLMPLLLLTDNLPNGWSSADGNEDTIQSKALEAYGSLPLLFTANNGQVDSSVLYYARVSGGKVYLTSSSIVLDLTRKDTASSTNKFAAIENEGQQAGYQRLVLRLNFEGANTNPEVIATEQTDSRVNYFIGNDQSKWLTDIPTYKEIVYQDIYPNTDLRLYGKEGMLTYDFIVHPGGDVSDVRLSLEGVESLDLSGRDLILSTALGELKQERLNIYQEDGVSRRNIEGNFRLLGDNSYGFAVAAYDRSADLVIDPALIYSTYLGGAGDDHGFGIALDVAGNAYLAGTTGSNPFPTTPGAFQTAYGGGTYDAYVAKLNAAGSALIYCTYLGGTGDDVTISIAVDAAGCAYVTGSTDSNPFPTTPGAFQTAFGGGADDAFITKLNAAGNALLYSTYLGGANRDEGYGIAVDTAGNAYVNGFTDSNPFPTTPGAFQTAFGGGTLDAFIAKLNASGSALLYSTYLGGAGEDVALGLAVDATDCAYVNGFTNSNPFPTTPGAFQTAFGGGTYDAFVTKLLMAAAVSPAPAPPAVSVPRAASTTPHPLNPSQMSLQYLSISPKQASANQPVTIISNVVNTGDEAGNLNVTLKINGQVEQSRMVSVGPQGTQPVKFTVTKAQPGTYNVDILGKSGSFTVLGAGSSASNPSKSNGLIALLIIGVLVLTTVVVLLISRRPA